MSALTDTEALLKAGRTPDALLVWKALDECKQLLWQYRDDLRHPVAPDSTLRRIDAINAVLGEAVDDRIKQLQQEQ